jgi:hypothetical protein
MFLRSNWLSPNYTALQPKISYFHANFVPFKISLGIYLRKPIPEWTYLVYTPRIDNQQSRDAKQNFTKIWALNEDKDNSYSPAEIQNPRRVSCLTKYSW